MLACATCRPPLALVLLSRRSRARREQLASNDRGSRLVFEADDPLELRAQWAKAGVFGRFADLGEEVHVADLAGAVEHLLLECDGLDQSVLERCGLHLERVCRL